MNETIKKSNGEAPKEELNLDDFLIKGNMREFECGQCGSPFEFFVAKGDPAPHFCSDCRQAFPWSLLLSTLRPFDYALRVRSGELWYFREAAIHGKWVRLKFATAPDNRNIPRVCLFEHGVDLRLDDIVWCADAPDGS